MIPFLNDIYTVKLNGKIIYFGTDKKKIEEIKKSNNNCEVSVNTTSVKVNSRTSRVYPSAS